MDARKLTILAACTFWSFVAVEHSTATPQASTALLQAQLSGEGADLFGGGSLGGSTAIAVDGDTLVVGAPWAVGTGSGKVHVFVRQQGAWTVQAVLDGPLLADSGFGGTVAIDGDTIVVGAYHAQRAYVYVRGTGDWPLQQELTNAGPSGAFGLCVDLEGDRIVVGAPDLNLPTVSVFTRSSGMWSVEDVLFPSGPLQNFGWSVALDETRIAVGAPHNFPFAGAAYVFVISSGTWSEEDQVGPLQGTTDLFGFSVDIDGDTLAVGQPFSDSIGIANDPGTVRVFTRSGSSWGLQDTLSHPVPTNNDAFGKSLNLQGERVLVGSSVWVFLGGTGPAAFLYERSGSTWSELLSIAGPNLQQAQSFANSVTLDDDTLVLGDGFESRVHVYVVGEDAGARYCTPAVANSTGAPARIDALGSPLVAEGDLTLYATELPPGQFGYFLASLEQDFDANPGDSQGNLCLGGFIHRLFPPVLHSGDFGFHELELDLSDVPQLGAIHGGETWNFQSWYRDWNPGPTSNFTDALTVVFL